MNNAILLSCVWLTHTTQANRTTTGHGAHMLRKNRTRNAHILVCVSDNVHGRIINCTQRIDYKTWSNKQTKIIFLLLSLLVYIGGLNLYLKCIICILALFQNHDKIEDNFKIEHVTANLQNYHNWPPLRFLSSKDRPSAVL